MNYPRAGVAVFGGSGGLGKKIVRELNDTQKYWCTLLSSKDVDLGDSDAVAKYFAQNFHEVVVNLAGVNFDSMIHKITYADMDHMVYVNIRGTMHLLRECLPAMRQKNKGTIILASSVLAKRPVVGTGVYSACKSFIDSIVQTTALENAGKGITCNSIRIGYCDAGMTHRIQKEAKAKLLESIPAQRLGEPEEIAKTIEFLIENPYVNGANLDVTGGL